MPLLNLSKILFYLRTGILCGFQKEKDLAFFETLDVFSQLWNFQRKQDFLWKFIFLFLKIFNLVIKLNAFQISKSPELNIKLGNIFDSSGKIMIRDKFFDHINHFNLLVLFQCISFLLRFFLYLHGSFNIIDAPKSFQYRVHIFIDLRGNVETFVDH